MQHHNPKSWSPIRERGGKCPEGPPRGRSSDHSPDGSAAREPSDIGPHNSESTAAWRQDQPRRGDPTMSPGREPRDTDPHEIPSSAVSAAQSAPRPRRQQPGGRPCTRTPMAPIESSQKQPKAAKRGHDRQARPRTIHDSGFHGLLNHGSRITDHGRFLSCRHSYRHLGSPPGPFSGWRPGRAPTWPITKPCQTVPTKPPPAAIRPAGRP